MSGNYVPLYRKYRPQTLDKLVGQEHIKKTLTSAIELGKIAHAFLFTGPRGTGKTSTARILAKSLNCKNGPTIHPCGECESCRDITNSVPIDVIEIDAASNRKVEDTQSILEKIQYVPVNGRYKIYIIDEVHMLTNHAFNALLKTLEEPPENVIFILATTEVHKVLDTIKSRCQRFDFRRITTEDIVKHLRYISDEEKINISDDALFTIAKNSAGGMRDSISLLDQLSLLGVSKQVTSEDVNAILGRISFDILNKLSSKIIDAKPNEAIEILNDIYNSGNEPLQILTNLSEYFKNLLIVKNCRKELLCELTGLNEPQIEELSKQKELLETHQIVFLLERITYYIKEVKMASNQHLWLEVGMIDLANMTENTTLLDLQNRVKALEGTGVAPAPRTFVQAASPQAPASRPVEPVTRPAPVPPQETPVVKPEPQPEPSEDFTPPPVSRKPDGNDIQSLWQTLLMNIKSPATKALLNLASPVKISPDEVIITFKNDKLVSQINDTNKKQMLVEAANTMFNQSDSKVIVRLPQANDAVVEKKKLTVEEPAPQPQPVPQAAEPQPVAVEEKNVPSKNIEREESDQEKMVLELFDGKYIE
ncbi:TPA: DNA polymerase III subunit gamma/tau [Candidatus Gastranaerophilales bacterium HUM_5]|nr:MAG TPA: DNA polymerase III subunit gamma/tau [Candidatus Gastranaerophilales bacterium HUM_4]DAA89902.1 MAG TPA: DNA polymerase III subunit gamma/tau [Candidatus Gastranaerophilales bacterium HUM_5]